jgi:hypothetical protein
MLCRGVELPNISRQYGPDIGVRPRALFLDVHTGVVEGREDGSGSSNSSTNVGPSKVATQNNKMDSSDSNQLQNSGADQTEKEKQRTRSIRLLPRRQEVSQRGDGQSKNLI